VTVARGDLYEAVGDRTFDRIVAHPPYVPEAETRIVFRDGGEDGEQVTRGIVEGLPRHMRPGGTLHCTCAVTDRVDRPFERRVRDWLGEAEAEFDVFFMPQATHEPTPYFLTRAMAGNEPWENLERRHATFTRLGVERIVYGAFVVRRRAAAARGTGPLTVRRRAAPAARGADVIAMMERETMAADPALQARLLDLPLATNPQLAFALTHGLVDGDWQATSCHLHVEAPFVVDAKVSPWLAALLVRCDGTRAPRAIVAELRAEGMAPADGTVEELVPLLRDLVAADILRPAPAPAPSVAAAAGAVAARG
jgi:hypothetical protein